jgi:hypothetical protein
LDEFHPTTERATIYGRSEPPEEPEVRNDVKFVLAVSLLRWKLWRKAKQEQSAALPSTGRPVVLRPVATPWLATAVTTADDDLRMRSPKPFE